MRTAVLIVASVALGIGILLMIVAAINAILYLFQGFDAQYIRATVSAMTSISLLLFSAMSFYWIRDNQNGPK